MALVQVIPLERNSSMMFLPFQILGVWLRALLILTLLGAGVYLLVAWYNRLPTFTEVVPPPIVTTREHRSEPDTEENQRALTRAPTVVVRSATWRPGLDLETAMLVGGLALIIWSFGGGLLGLKLLRPRAVGDCPAKPLVTIQTIRGASGADLHVEISGPIDGLPVVLTHGWGLDGGEWCYAREQLARSHRVIVWDLPGLGESGRPAANDWSLEKLAGDLNAVLALAGDRPAVLVGHSIGGMITLTFCKLFPESLGHRVSGLVLAQTTYTNPVKTAGQAWLYTPLQKPVLEPLCHLMVWLSPVLWALNWLSYLNGSAHRSTERGSFSGHENRFQLESLTRKFVAAWPGVIGRGMLAMFRYDATAILAGLNMPTLVVIGDRDESCSPEAGDFMARSVPDARLVRLSDARHCGLYEYHGAFNAAVAEFVDACARPSAIPHDSLATDGFVKPDPAVHG
jgi:pimeloyl-ACP methyl ester carboxylesterase